MKALAARIALLLGALLLALAGAEAVVRVIAPRQVPAGLDGAYEAGGYMMLDSELGWRTRPNLDFSGTVKDHAGAVAERRVTTDAWGFRHVGDPTPEVKRVLVVGDSFTFALDASDADCYAARLEAALPDVVVFAYGVDGYGPLQEAMILRESIERIRPDLVLWQFSSNDVLNSDLALERRSLYNRSPAARPYLQADGSVATSDPSAAWGLRKFARRRVRLLDLAFEAWTFRARRAGEGVEREIADEGENHAGFQRAARTLERILSKAREEWPDLATVGFCADSWEPYRTEIRRIAVECGIAWIPDVPEAVAAGRAESVEPYAADGTHWSSVGHRIAAGALAESLAEMLEVGPPVLSSETVKEHAGTP